MPTSIKTCDIFCTVIDNYGDLGVCWRLARHLHHDHALTVRLWIDDLISFKHLAPALSTTQQQQMLDGITVMHWQPQMADAEPGDLIIEGFGCELPEAFIQAMTAQSPHPAWLNLEYLSAEPWIEDCHALPSVHAASGLIKHFWFPGFTPASGGLLRSAGELEQIHDARRPARKCRQVSLFSYRQTGIGHLLDALAADETRTLLKVFPGQALTDVSNWLGRTLTIGEEVSRGELCIRVLPLLHHTEYDRLLADSDLNLVRGEDSFVRAQWAGNAMLWHIYPQEDDAHLIKLDAWQARVEGIAAMADTPMPASWGQALTAWNHCDSRHPESLANWCEFLADLPAIHLALASWRQYLLAQPDLATQLMRFYADRVESRPK
ncbi:MAG: elongation factor P maturation arginine rhamnosyltransferase EarP [Pseudomonadota bacterium]